MRRISSFLFGACAIAGLAALWALPVAAQSRPGSGFAVASIEPITDATTGVKIGIPASLGMRTQIEPWGRNWQSPNRKLSVDTINYGNTKTLDDYFRGLKNKSNRVITSEHKDAGRFILKGYDRGPARDQNSIFHVEAHVGNGELRGLSIVYSESHQRELAPLAELIARSFEPFPARVQPAVAVNVPPPPPVRPAPPQVAAPNPAPVTADPGIDRRSGDHVDAQKRVATADTDINQRFQKLSSQVEGLMDVIRTLQQNNQQNSIVEELKRQLAEAKKDLANAKAKLDDTANRPPPPPVIADAKPLGRKLALVIGNDTYPNLGRDAQLRKAVNDARGIRNALADLGFEVMPGGDNLDRKGMSDLFIRFLDRIRQGDTAFVFFSGHGVAVNGGNFLLPTDASPFGASVQAQIRAMAISEAEWIAGIQERGAGTAIVVLDACRDNPLNIGGTKSAANTRGLTRTSVQGQGVFAIYSAGFGQKALDTLGPSDRAQYSVFTRVFIDMLYKPNTHLDDVMYQVREEVSKLAESVHHQQEPASYNQVRGGRIYLRLAAPSAEAIGGR